VPIIAKADAFTVDELRQFKATIKRDLQTHQIKVYEFPDFVGNDVKVGVYAFTL
jgi:septin family protein